MAKINKFSKIIEDLHLEELYILEWKKIKKKKNQKVRLKELPQITENIKSQLKSNQLTNEELAKIIHLFYRKYLLRAKTLRKAIEENEWNYFINIKYNKELFSSEEDFKNKIKNSLTRYADRYKWCYVYCFDHDESNQFYLTGILYIPPFEEEKDILTIQKINKYRKKLKPYYQSKKLSKLYPDCKLEKTNKEKQGKARINHLIKNFVFDEGKITYSRHKEKIQTNRS